MGYTGEEAKWHPEARSKQQAAEAMPANAKQPRRRAGRRAGAHRRGEEPPTRSTDLDSVDVGRLRLRAGWQKFHFSL
jgi:hypothetical protein